MIVIVECVKSSCADVTKPCNTNTSSHSVTTHHCNTPHATLRASGHVNGGSESDGAVSRAANQALRSGVANVGTINQPRCLYHRALHSARNSAPADQDRDGPDDPAVPSNPSRLSDPLYRYRGYPSSLADQGVLGHPEQTFNENHNQFRYENISRIAVPFQRNIRPRTRSNSRTVARSSHTCPWAIIVRMRRYSSRVLACRCYYTLLGFFVSRYNHYCLRPLVLWPVSEMRAVTGIAEAYPKVTIPASIVKHSMVTMCVVF